MNHFKRIVVTLNVYAFLMIIGAFFGMVCLYLLVGTLYLATYPGPVTNSAECARGMLAGFLALFGGGLTGASIGCYGASRLLFERKLSNVQYASIDYSLLKREWTVGLGRRLRAATHYACAGGIVIACCGLGSPTVIRTTFPLGLLTTAVGGIAFVRAHLLDHYRERLNGTVAE